MNQMLRKLLLLKKSCREDFKENEVGHEIGFPNSIEINGNVYFFMNVNNLPKFLPG